MLYRDSFFWDQLCAQDAVFGVGKEGLTSVLSCSWPRLMVGKVRKAKAKEPKDVVMTPKDSAGNCLDDFCCCAIHLMLNCMGCLL